MLHNLICHPHTPARTALSVQVEWTADDGNEALLTFIVGGSATLMLPDQQSPARANDLWKTTCFEMFWKPVGGHAYVEFNFSPSLRWAAYRFDAYRDGMRDHPVAVDPFIEVNGGEPFMMNVDIDFATMQAGTAHIGLSAVIEEADGTKSYWALAHPPGAPDFHHPDCFALELPAVA